MLGGGPVLLTVPTTADHRRLARVVASGLASRLGCSIDGVDDVRLAIDELCFAVAGRGSRDGRLHLRFELGDGLLVLGEVTDGAGAAPPGLSPLTEKILTTLCLEHAVEGSTFRARLRVA